MLYYMYNKPKGCITACSDRLCRTVMDDFPSVLRNKVYPIGRLDKDTEGLLLVTDDGKLACRLMRPRSHISKTYFFYAIGELTEEKIKAAAEGLHLEGFEYPALPAVIRSERSGVITEIEDHLPENRRERYLKNPSQKYFAGYITITEGKKHQVKRMLSALGCHIVYLKRTAIGGVILDEALEKGSYRPLTEEEIQILKEHYNEELHL